MVVVKKRKEENAKKIKGEMAEWIKASDCKSVEFFSS